MPDWVWITVAERAEEVLIRQGVDQALFIFVRDKVAAISVCADLQYVLDIVVIALADVVPEGLLVSCGCSAGLILRLVLDAGLSGERNRSRSAHHLINLLLTLQTLDILGEVGDFLFHLVVGCGILRRNHAAVLRVRVQKCLSGLPCLRSHFP